MVKHKFQVGDVVHICNPYGIYLGKHKIIGLDERTNAPTYYYENSDTPWFSVHERYISKDPEEILTLMWEKLTTYRKGTLNADNQELNG